MADQAYRRWNSSGELEIVYPDGRLEIWNTSTGQLVREAPANPRLAEAMRAGDTNTMQQTIDYGTQWLASPLGKDYISTRQAAADEERRRWDAQFGLNKDARDLSRDELDFRRDQWGDQYGLQRDEFAFRSGPQFQQTVKESDARILDLERQYGLDASRLYLDYNKQAIDYAKTPRSWIDALDWERAGQGGGIPVYTQNLAMNLQNPAFGAKGAGTPQMNSLGNAVADASGQPGVAQTDPTAEVTKAIAGIAKLSPPSNTVGMSGRDAATIQLMTELYKGGAGKIGEGVWESLDADEQDTMLGAFDRISANGGSRFLRDHQRTRIPTSSRVNAA